MMQEKLSSEQMVSFLKNVSELEASVYQQTEALRKVETELKNRKQPKMRAVPRSAFSAAKKLKSQKPQEPKKPQKPKEPVEPAPVEMESVDKLLLAVSIIAIMVGLFISPVDSELAVIGISVAIIGLLLCSILILNVRKNNKRNQLEYQSALSKYQGKLSEYQVDFRRYQDAYEAYTSKCEEYQKRLSQAKRDDEINYAERCAEENSRYEKVLEADSQVCALVKKEMAPLRHSLSETKKTLAAYYATDIIFPKYRNFVSMNTIYEYFASGRCSELTGANGAYNLYEAEVRQNVIINSLDKIIDSLQQIRNNQYMLYDAISETNQILTVISKDASRIERATEQIVRNTQDIASATEQITIFTHLTAVNSKAVAQNTEAIKYLTLING